MKRERSFLSTGEIATHCQVSQLTVLNWIRAGKLPASRTPGGHYRVRREDFLPFLIEYNFPIPPEFAPEQRRILVVDDDRPLLNLMEHTLQEAGYHVSVASDGYEAGLKMATFKPDLLVLDLIMPGVDGFAVCKRVRATPEQKQTKILVITGFIQEGGVAKALECGADLCLEKPFHMEMLKDAVAQLLGHDRREASGGLGVERRRSQRVQVELPVTCTVLSAEGQAIAEPLQGKTINVSRDGMLLALDARPEPFSLLALEIFLPRHQEPLHVLGEVRLVREEPGEQGQEVEIEFIAMQDQDRERWGEEIYMPPKSSAPSPRGRGESMS